jgi:hypothetical protein
MYFTANYYFSSIDFLSRTSVPFVTGKIDIQLSVDVPADIELVEPLQESSIWRQARGAATEISEMDDPTSIDKVLLQMKTFFS